MSWREYHEATKHSVQSLRLSTHVLDWANMPDPFRHYEGAPVVDLPADPPGPDVPALAVLQGAHGRMPVTDGPGILSQLLFYSAAISASKRVPSTGYRYALRVNPSSGNLHPTEFHFITRELAHWEDGLYHYRPSAHMAERRATGSLDLNVAGNVGARPAPITFVLSSIAWREAWKYRERAYRYCLLDIGHAWQALSLAAQAMGWRSSASGHFLDDGLARCCRLHEDEWPMLIVQLFDESVDAGRGERAAVVWHEGRANHLSDSAIDYPRIDQIHRTTKLSETAGQDIRASALERLDRAEAEISGEPFGEIARRRRSALDFQGGARTISLGQLAAILSAVDQPLACDFGAQRWIELYLYVHRVEGLEPGVYRYRPHQGGLQLVRPGDQRVMAAGLSLGQDLAGNACVAFSMIADLEGATRLDGDRGYRYAYFEAGAIGHRLYLAAEALGLGATGIGAFYDDEVYRYLALTSGQVVYHFAIGYPIPDSRLNA